jgi:hypothetical protein
VSGLVDRWRAEVEARGVVSSALLSRRDRVRWSLDALDAVAVPGSLLLVGVSSDDFLAASIRPDWHCQVLSSLTELRHRLGLAHASVIDFSYVRLSALSCSEVFDWLEPIVSRSAHTLVELVGATQPQLAESVALPLTV